MDYGLNVTVNSDDPSYFKGYLNQNFINIYENLDLSKDDIIKLVKNSFISSFLDESAKIKYLKRVDEVVNNFKG